MNASSPQTTSQNIFLASCVLFIATLTSIPSLQAKNKNRNRFEKNTTVKEKKTRKTIATMNLQELEERKQKAIAGKEIDIAIKYTEQQLKICDDIGKLASLCIELADLHFDLGQYEPAIKLYSEFCTLYPGNKLIEYAEYRTILALELCTLQADRDQTKTEETIDHCKKFIARDFFTTYKQEVIDIQRRCYLKLMESDIRICQFYLNQKTAESSFVDIENRLETIKTAYLPHVPEAKSMLIEFEIQYAEKKQDPALREAKQQSLHELIIQTDAVVVGKNRKKGMADRF